MADQISAEWDGSAIGPGPIGVLPGNAEPLHRQEQQLVLGTALRPDLVSLSLGQLGDFVFHHRDQLFVIDDSKTLAEIASTLLAIGAGNAQILLGSIDASRWIANDVLRSLVGFTDQGCVRSRPSASETNANNAENQALTPKDRSQIGQKQYQNHSFRDRISELLGLYSSLKVEADALFSETARPREPEYRLKSLPVEVAERIKERSRNFVQSLSGARQPERITAITTPEPPPASTDRDAFRQGSALKGSLVAAIISSNKSTHGLCLDPTKTKDLAEEAESIYVAASRRLRSSTDTVGCFRWDGERVELNERGHPTTKGLEGWLENVEKRLVDRQNLPVPIPQRKGGGPSLNPEFWRIWAACDRHLWAWRQLNVAAELIRLVNANSETVVPKYSIFPFFRTFEPNLSAYRRQQVRVFQPSEGNVFLVGCLPELRLRCFVEVGIRRNYFSRNTSRLASYLFHEPEAEDQDQEFPIARLAREFYLAEAVWPIDGAAKGTSLEAARSDAQQRFLDLQETNSNEYESLLNRVAGLLDAAILGIPTQSLASFLEHEHGVRTVANDEAERSINLLATYIVPELSAYRANPTRDLVWAALGRSAQDAYILQAQAEYPGAEPARVQNVLLASGVEQLGLGPDTHPPSNQPLAPGEPSNLASGPAASLFRYRGLSLGGRVTILGSAPIVRQLEILHSADEIMMEVAFAIVSHGYRLVGIADDEYVVEVPRGKVDSVQEEILGLALRAADRLLGKTGTVVIVSQSNTW